MACPFFSSTFALATATVISFGWGQAPVSAQPVTPSLPPAAPQPKQQPEVQEAPDRLAKERQSLSGLAQAAEAREDWKEAESRLRDLLKLAPDNVVVRQRLAHALFGQTKENEAYEVLKEAKKDRS